MTSGGLLERIGGWMTLVAAATVAVGLLGLLAWRLWRDAAEGRAPVPGFASVWCVGAASPDAVARHLLLAMSCLASVWPRQTSVFRFALQGWCVEVRPDDAPWTSYGRKVGGTEDRWTKRIVVGRSMDGLAHELAHVLERHIDGTEDLKHAQWVERGIYPAIERYQAARKELAA